jgi:hypothetical protein
MNNTDESFFFTVGVLKLLTFSLHKMLVMYVDYSAALNLSGKEQSPYCFTCVAVAKTEMLPVERGGVD